MHVSELDSKQNFIDYWDRVIHTKMFMLTNKLLILSRSPVSWSKTKQRFGTAS